MENYFSGCHDSYTDHTMHTQFPQFSKDLKYLGSKRK